MDLIAAILGSPLVASLVFFGAGWLCGRILARWLGAGPRTARGLAMAAGLLSMASVPLVGMPNGASDREMLRAFGLHLTLSAAGIWLILFVWRWLARRLAPRRDPTETEPD